MTGVQPQAKCPEGCEYYQADFASEQSIQDFAAIIIKRRPDILINNAGINKINKFCDITLNDFKLIQQVNVLAPFVLC